MATIGFSFNFAVLDVFSRFASHFVLFLITLRMYMLDVLKFRIVHDISCRSYVNINHSILNISKACSDLSCMTYLFIAKSCPFAS